MNEIRKIGTERLRNWGEWQRKIEEDKKRRTK